MESFKIISERSIIGLIIKMVMTTLMQFGIIVFLIDKYPVEKNIINTLFIVIIVSNLLLIYKFLTEETILMVHNNTLIYESKTSVFQKNKISKFDLTSVEKIRLIQSQNFIDNEKTMELIDENGAKQILNLKLRYFQLVKLQKYFNDKLNIKTSLIG